MTNRSPPKNALKISVSLAGALPNRRVEEPVRGFAELALLHETSSEA